jgi:hypothetical protein
MAGSGRPVATTSSAQAYHCVYECTVSSVNVKVKVKVKVKQSRYRTGVAQRVPGS